MDITDLLNPAPVDVTTAVQKLPQELQDIIADYTLYHSTTVSKMVTISTDYKPPAELSISRASRDIFATNYYNNTWFVIPYKAGDGNLMQWLNSLSYGHCSHVRFVLMCPPSARIYSPTFLRLWLQRVQERIQDLYGDDEPCADDDCLYVKTHAYVLKDDAEGRESESSDDGTTRTDEMTSVEGGGVGISGESTEESGSDDHEETSEDGETDQVSDEDSASEWAARGARWEIVEDWVNLTDLMNMT